ncbi:hypothetical protein ACWF94_02125 [Streptomyces sp. NPDC055078]
MHGPGYAPPPPGRRPSNATLVWLRVLFVALAVLSCGFLSWAPLLRLALVRRRTLDWVLFAVVLVAAITTFVLVVQLGSEGEDLTPIDVVLLSVLFAMVVGVPTHYLVAEIHHYQERPAPGPWGQHSSPYGAATIPYGQPLAGGYGYPPVAAGPGYPPAPTPGPGNPAHQPPAHQAPAPRPAAPRVPAPQPSPADPPAQGKPRIDQVRAELDELSDYLRKEQGR